MTISARVASDPAVAPAGRTRRSRRSTFDVERVRADFPILSRTVHGKPLVYLDNAATTQKPQVGPRRDRRTTTRDINANVHRGVHELSARATDALRGGARARPRVPQRRQIARDRLHAQRHRGHQPRRPELRAAAARRRATRSSSRRWSTTRTSCRGSWSASRPARGCASRRSTTAASCSSSEFERLLGPRTRIVAITHMSNALGTINPVERDRRASRTRAACRCCSTARRRRITCAVDVQALGLRLLRR